MTSDMLSAVTDASAHDDDSVRDDADLSVDDGYAETSADDEWMSWADDGVSQPEIGWL